MLALTLRYTESVVLLDARTGRELCEVKVCRRSFGGQVVLGFEAPPDVKILRRELLERDAHCELGGDSGGA